MISTILPDNLTTPLSYLHSPAPSLVNLTLNYTLNLTGDPVLLPGYLRVTSMALCIAIMALGVVGNVMVPLVIFNTKDMRNSTNIFLVNLSVADLMVLLVCTPTVLVEVNSRPETWVLGREMCKAVPFVELTVAHASVLTILAISFERYYAICKPLKAGYVCTKARASCICLLAWLVAALFTSPILAITYYGTEEYYDGSLVHVCFSLVDSLLPCLFFIISIVVFFVVPLGMLLCIYSLIARTLMAHPSAQTSKGVMHPAQSVIKYRRQVVVMLGAVVIAFFLCLLPFRALTLWIVVAPAGATITIGIENYYNILYFCRIMFYINSAINPILYNIMSSKFRGGFFRLCGARQLRRRWQQRAELLRKSTNSSSHNSSQQTSDTTSGSRGSSRSGSKRRPSLQHQSSLSSMQHQVSLPPLPRLEGVREVEAEGESAFKVGDKGTARDFFIRAPLEVVNGINGQRMPAGEIYV